MASTTNLHSADVEHVEVNSAEFSSTPNPRTWDHNDSKPSGLSQVTPFPKQPDYTDQAKHGAKKGGLQRVEESIHKVADEIEAELKSLSGHYGKS